MRIYGWLFKFIHSLFLFLKKEMGCVSSKEKPSLSVLSVLNFPLYLTNGEYRKYINDKERTNVTYISIDESLYVAYENFEIPRLYPGFHGLVVRKKDPLQSYYKKIFLIPKSSTTILHIDMENLVYEIQDKYSFRQLGKGSLLEVTF